MINAEFPPPKPEAVFKIVFISLGLFFVIIAKGALTPCSSYPNDANKVWCFSDSREKIVSTIPAAPSVWPMYPL